MSGPSEDLAAKQREYILGLVRRIERLEAERAAVEARCVQCEEDTARILFEILVVCETVAGRLRGMKRLAALKGMRMAMEEGTQ